MVHVPCVTSEAILHEGWLTFACAVYDVELPGDEGGLEQCVHRLAADIVAISTNNQNTNILHV